MGRQALKIAVIVICLSAVSLDAFALDKRLRLMFKTAGYGAAAGFVLGAGSIALGMGGGRNILMGTSAGMYAGIALAGYIILTPNENEPPRRGRGVNPYAPRPKVTPDDYQDEDQINEVAPPPPESRLEAPKEKRPELVFWAPVIGLRF